MWITNGGFADLFTIFAKVVDGDRGAGAPGVNEGKFTGFLVERGMGVVSGRDEIKLGLDGSSTTALMLDSVKVPIENVLGVIGQGHKVAFNVLNFGRVKLGARNMSGVKAALGHAVKYAKERRQFGKAIAEFGLVFLLFTIGLEFSLPRLIALRRMVVGLGGARDPGNGSQLSNDWTCDVVLESRE
jgi:alkylation response protein AidB-like acyl-CoA dehydrogenase